MRDEDLVDVERRLRSMLRDAGLQWVLDQVDQAIADGLPQERVLRRRRRSRAEPLEDDYGDAFEATSPRDSRDSRTAKRSGNLVITTVPYSAEQRVRAFISAVRLVALGLPEIEAEAVELMTSTRPRGADQPDHTSASGGVADEVTSAEPYDATEPYGPTYIRPDDSDASRPTGQAGPARRVRFMSESPDNPADRTVSPRPDATEPQLISRLSTILSRLEQLIDADE